MAYDQFTDAKPVAADTGNQFADYTRENLMALRDAVTMGAMRGWNYAPTPGTGTAEQPQYATYSKNDTTEALRATITWGTTGGATGNPTAVLWQYTVDDTADPIVWDTIGTESMTYDTDGNPTAVTWS